MIVRSNPLSPFLTRWPGSGFSPGQNRNPKPQEENPMRLFKRHPEWCIIVAALAVTALFVALYEAGPCRIYLPR